jgi:uncharacterized protein with von Willebrand factor type A (vWA) domain
LYWAARLTLVNRAEDLPTFDAVISAVFDDAVLGLDPPSLKSSLGGAVAAVPGLSRAHGTTLDGAGLPWTTRPKSITAADATQDETGVNVPDVLPSRLVARVDDAFETFDDADLRLIGSWLEQVSARWPRRPGPTRPAAQLPPQPSARASRSASG